MYDILEVKAIRVVRVGRRHKVGVAHIQAVIESVEPIMLGDKRIFVGVDDRGVELEIVAIPDDRDPDRLAVIHAMPTALRRKDEE
jgi:hypothetical protein